jgi:hypothetical protein
MCHYVEYTEKYTLCEAAPKHVITKTRYDRCDTARETGYTCVDATPAKGLNGKPIQLATSQKVRGMPEMPFLIPLGPHQAFGMSAFENQFQWGANLLLSRTTMNPMAVIVTKRADLWEESGEAIVNLRLGCWMALYCSIVSYKSNIIDHTRTFYMCEDSITIGVVALPTV